MKLRLFLMLIAGSCVAETTWGQVERTLIPTDPAGSQWYSKPNWTDNLVPSRDFSEIGSITVGRYAYVDSAMADGTFDGADADPGEIRLGVTGGGGPNILEIRSGGTMHVQLITGDLSDGGIEVGSPNGNGTLRVLPGGTLTVDGAILQSFTAAPFGPSMVVVGGAAAGAATLNAASGNFAGVFQTLANSDVNFSNSMTFTGAATFRPEIRTASNAKVDVTNIAALDGQLTVDFNGFTPSPGQSWTIMEAGDIQGGFDAINSPQVGLGATLIPAVVSSGGRELLNVTYSTSLVLTVDRDSGAVAITNPNAPNIMLDGYSIRSASSKLNPANWTSLDQGNLLGGDWRESNAAETRLTELKPDGSGSFPGNGTIPLGSVYDPNSSPFTSGEDLIFDYTDESGAVIQGQIVYSGTRVNNLLLHVDPSTGEARLRNTSGTTVSIDGYDIASVGGSLVAGNWDSFDDQGLDGNTWRQTPTSNQFRLSELNPDTSLTLSPGEEYDFGAIWDLSDPDLVFRFLQDGNQFPTVGVVLYTALSTAVDGDFDNDGDVDGRDFLRWQRGMSPNGTPGVSVSASDLALWQANYGTGGLSSLSTSSVPEPSALMLTLAGFGAIFLLRRDGN